MNFPEGMSFLLPLHVSSQAATNMHACGTIRVHSPPKLRTSMSSCLVGGLTSVPLAVSSLCVCAAAVLWRVLPWLYTREANGASQIQGINRRFYHIETHSNAGRTRFVITLSIVIILHSSNITLLIQIRHLIALLNQASTSNSQYTNTNCCLEIHGWWMYSTDHYPC